MKPKVAIFLIAAAMILPAITSVFDLDARRRPGPVVIVVAPEDPQFTVSPN